MSLEQARAESPSNWGGNVLVGRAGLGTQKVGGGGVPRINMLLLKMFKLVWCSCPLTPVRSAGLTPSPPNLPIPGAGGEKHGTSKLPRSWKRSGCVFAQTLQCWHQQGPVLRAPGWAQVRETRASYSPMTLARMGL